MLKRRVVLFLMVLMATAIISVPKNVYAGTCNCTYDESGTPSIGSNNCDSNTEYYSCITYGYMEEAGTTCQCRAKTNTNLGENKCSCDERAIVSNCSASSPYPFCRGTVCVCSAIRTIDSNQLQDQENTSNTTTTNLSSSDYNPFAGCTSSSINTALGCIPVEMEKFVPWLLTWLFGVAGGIAFLLMAYGFILIATSAGDEKKVQGARETITSAIIGLLVCIFAIFILRLIAVNILQIPGIS